MKKKILFYGNCHVSTIGKWLHQYYSDKFEITDCEECGVNPSHSTKNFAIWMDSLETQQSYSKCIHEKIKQADFFIYQGIENAAIDELKTEFLVNNVVTSNCVSVCIPNPRFYAFPIDYIPLKPYVKYVYNNITKDKNEIEKYIVNENDPVFKDILFSNYDSCMSENRKRYDLQCTSGVNKIEMIDFIENNWKDHQLFATHNHPCGIYWTEMITKLFQILGEDLIDFDIKQLNYPNSHAVLNIKRFSFLNKLFPDLKVPKEIKLLIDPLNVPELYLSHGLCIVKDPLEQYI